MTRFFVPFHAILATFAAMSLWVLLQLTHFKKRAKYMRVGIVCVLAVMLSLEYATGIYRPSFDFNNAPKPYQWLKQQKNIKTIAEFPIVDPLDAHTTRYVTYQVVHGKNIVNMREPNSNRLTNTLGSIDNPETIDLAYRRGAQAIVTHDRQCNSDVSWGKLIHSGGDSPSGTICIYSLVRPMSEDQLFVRFNKGFKYYPNLPNNDHSLASVETPSGAYMQVVHSDFVSRVKGSARLTATIADFHNNRISGSWLLKQDGVVIQTGMIRHSSATIDAVIDSSKGVEVELVPDDGVEIRQNDLSMNGVVVTAIP